MTPPPRPSPPATVFSGFPAADAPPPRTQRKPRRGGFAAGLLILVATVVLVLAWPLEHVRRGTAPDRLADNATAILANDAVRQAIADDISDRIIQRVGAESELNRRAIRAAVTPRVTRLVSSDRFAAVWNQSVATAAARLTDPDVDYVAVTIDDFTGLIAATSRAFPASIARPLERAGPVVVLYVDRTAEQQRGVELLDWLNGLAVPGLIFGLVLLLLAVAVSHNRRQTVRTIGIVLTLIAALMLLLAAAVRAAVVDGSDAAIDRQITEIVVDQLLGDFRNRTMTVGIVGIALIVATVTVGLLSRERPRPPAASA